MESCLPEVEQAEPFGGRAVLVFFCGRWLVGRRIFVSPFAFGCVVIVSLLSSLLWLWGVWLVVSVSWYVDVPARLLSVKRRISELPELHVILCNYV